MAKKVKSGVKNTNKGTNTPTWDKMGSNKGKILNPKAVRTLPSINKGGGKRGS